MRKVHLACVFYRGGTDVEIFAHCGSTGLVFTRDLREITCKKCKAWAAKFPDLADYDCKHVFR